MNTLGVNCYVKDGLGHLVVVALLNNNNVSIHVFKSPSIFSFSNNSAEILNWHKDNVLSLLSFYNIDAFSVKKTETNSQGLRLKKSEIFKLYMEGTMLSLAGSNGIKNNHYYTNDIKTILDEGDVLLNVTQIASKYNLKISDTILASNEEKVRNALLSALSIQKNN